MGLLRLIVAAAVVSGTLLALGGMPRTALADSVVVGDSGDFACSQTGLASAIDAAATTDPDAPGLVTFACSDNTIEFTSQITIGGGVSGSTQAVIIDGSNGGNQIVFDANSASRFFHIRFRGYVTLQQITFQEGKASNGGAIYNDGGRLTVDQCDFIENAATNQGGAISSRETAIISQSTFTKNTAHIGGAIYGVAGNLTIERSSFTENQASNSGGAVTNASTMVIHQSTFTGNVANGMYGAGGGAIYSSENVGRLTIDRSTFIENKALNTLAYGGAISSNNAQLTVTESRFESNEATGGGAIYQSSSNTTVINRSAFVNNKGQVNGGGAVASRGGKLSVVASTFTGNTSTAMGSVIRVSSSNGPSHFAWSTIIQPEGTDPALYLDESLTLEGVILGGSGTHCEFDGGSLTNSYTLANDTSCGLAGMGSQQVTADNGLTELGLGSVLDATVNGVVQSYYPLLATGPALNGPATCDSGIIADADPERDQLGNLRPVGDVCSIGAIQLNNLPPVIYIDSPYPIEIDEGYSIQIALDDPEESSVSYEIDCDTSDGVIDTADESANMAIFYDCAYPDSGQFDGLVTVVDGPATSTLPFSVTVNNVAPVLNPITTSPSLAGTNQPISIQMSATDVPADKVTFTVDCFNTLPDGVVGPISSETGIFEAVGSCSYTSSGFYFIGVYATDDDGGISELGSIGVVVVPTMELCANQWSGALRVSDDCSRSETQIVLPQDGPQTLCVNQWNGSASFGNHCSRSERAIVVTGDQSVSACVNSWNGSLRVSGSCSRSEREVWL